MHPDFLFEMLMQTKRTGGHGAASYTTAVDSGPRDNEVHHTSPVPPAEIKTK